MASNTPVNDDIKPGVLPGLEETTTNKEWPSLTDIDILSKKAAEPFLYASAVVKFDESDDGLPTTRLTLRVRSIGVNTHPVSPGYDIGSVLKSTLTDMYMPM